jgi:hypothetical protein
VLLEVEQRLKAMALNGIFCQGGLLDAEPGDLLLEVGVVLAGVAQIDVVGPRSTKVVAGTVKEALERSYRSRTLRPSGAPDSTGRRTWTASAIVWASRTATRTRTFLNRTKKDSMR